MARDVFWLMSPLAAPAFLYGIGDASEAMTGLAFGVSGILIRSMPLADPRSQRLRTGLSTVYFIAGTAMVLFGDVLKAAPKVQGIAAHLQKIYNCPASREIWNKLQKEKGAIAVVMGSSQEAPGGAIRDPSKGRIVLSDSLNDEGQLATLLEQACEWLEGADLEEISRLGYQGKLSKLDLLKRAVEPGFKAQRTHHAIASTCIKDHGWHPHTDMFKDSCTQDLETAWSRFLTDPIYAPTREAYYKDWTELFKGPFCKNSPHHSDCR